MTIGVYKITNKKTGQMYIGKSTNIEKRFKEHINGHGCPSSYIDNAIKKYGKDYFNFKIIEEFDKDTPFLNDVLNDKEQYYIAVYNTFGNDFHYNLTIGGDGTCGFTHSEETKKKISEAKSGKNHPFYGKPFTEEHKKKISKAHIGKKISKETKKKMSEAKSGKNNPRYGKKHSKETKKKMSESKKGKYTDENHPMWRNYARIIKAGKKNNKQLYAIKYQGKIIKRSISLDKLKKWFSDNYPNEELKF